MQTAAEKFKHRPLSAGQWLFELKANKMSQQALHFFMEAGNWAEVFVIECFRGEGDGGGKKEKKETCGNELNLV